MHRSHRLISAVALIVSALAAGCDGGEGSGATTSSGAGSSGAGGHADGGVVQPVAWGPCPEETGYTVEPGNECATIDVPLDHEDPQGETIPLFVARRLSGKAGAPQLWLLDGGPGSSGEDFFWGLVGQLAQALPDVDIYVPAHRGTGRSAGLTCAGEAHGTPRDVELSPEEWKACSEELTAKWGKKLAFFNTTSAAKDTGLVIDRVRAPDQKVFLYGLSYGTYLLWRYLALFPDQASGVIQDSIVSPGELFVSQVDQSFEPVLADYAALCKADALCSSKLGPDPMDRIAKLFTAVDGGHCAAAGFDRALLRQTLGQSLMGWRARLLGLAVAYRLERCAPEDLTALQAFKDLYYSPYDLDGFSHGLEVNIDFSELWESPAPSAAEMKARGTSRLASIDWGVEHADVYFYWSKYPADAYALAWPTTKLPMLMLNGTLDTETPFDTAHVAAAHYQGAHQTFVTLPGSPHGGGYQSPTTLADALPCGVKIIGSFVTAPEAAPDTSCIAAMKPVEFEDVKFAKSFFKTGSVWENVPPAPAKPGAGAEARVVIPRGHGRRPLVLR
jgi:pimeloyl-ACP methyl ester carboxylesterase